MKVHTVGYRARNADGGKGQLITEMMVTRWPLWAWLLDALVMDVLCRITRHRFCNSALMNWAVRLGDSRTEIFLARVEPADIERWQRWRWNEPAFWEDDDED
jgi:hypothetical protein